MPRPPVTPFVTGPFGAYDSVRTNPSEGACGVGKYPCQHFGSDIPGKVGTIVSAPCDGWVLASYPTNSMPFGGYGPSIVLLAHDDRKNNDRGFMSVRYSLLAHLDPEELRYSIPYHPELLTASMSAPALADGIEPGQQGGTAAQKAGWAALEDGTIARVGKVAASWSNVTWPGYVQYVKEGEWLGKIGDARHVHWEVRTQPLANTSGRLDPRKWLAFFNPDKDWGEAAPSKIVTSGKAKGDRLIVGGVLMALAAWQIFGEGRKRGGWF
jgi:hypothetical protein